MARSHRSPLVIALVVSVGLHLALALWLWTRPAPPAWPASSVVEIEVREVEKPRAPEPPKAATAEPPRPSRPRPVAVAPRKTEASSLEPASSSQPQIGELAPESSSSSFPVQDDLPRRIPGSDRQLALGLSAGASARLSAPGELPSAPDAGPTEAAQVKARVDSMVAEAQAAVRTVDVGVQELGRSFEQAGVRASLAPEEQRWVDTAVNGYRARAGLYGRLGKPDGNAWDRIETRAVGLLDHRQATYVALVAVHQGPDGRLLDLKLVVSSGTPEFDNRALGSVAHGVLADARPLTISRPDGVMSLWALMGDRQASPAAQAVGKVARYVLLDVVDLKPTVVDLERGGVLEHLVYSAQLLATF